MGHVNSVLMAVAKCPNPTVFQKTLSVNDFYFGSPDWHHPMGHISFVGKLDGVTLSAGAPAIAPGWTLELMGKHSIDFWLTSEDLPDPDNRVTLDRDGRIVLAYTPNNGEGHKRLIGKVESLMQRQTACAIHGHDCHQGLFARNLFVVKLAAIPYLLINFIVLTSIAFLGSSFLALVTAANISEEQPTDGASTGLRLGLGAAAIAIGLTYLAMLTTSPYGWATVSRLRSEGRIGAGLAALYRLMLLLFVADTAAGILLYVYSRRGEAAP